MAHAATDDQLQTESHEDDQVKLECLSVGKVNHLLCVCVAGLYLPDTGAV